MSESKHTPGPWIKDGGFIRSAVNDIHVCLTTLHEKPAEERDANQSLICAAPEMLQKLKDVIHARGILLESEVFEIINLIKKAEPEYETSFPFAQ